jgi:DNA-binding NtrC family response regulator
VPNKMALVENDPVLGMLLEEVFAEEQIEVNRCRTLAEVYTVVGTGEVDVILADTWGAGHHELGEDESAEIIDLGRRAPLILITGRSSAERFPEGALDTVVIVRQPMDLEVLAAEVSAAIKRGHDDPVITLTRARARQLLLDGKAEEIAVAVLALA